MVLTFLYSPRLREELRMSRTGQSRFLKTLIVLLMFRGSLWGDSLNGRVLDPQGRVVAGATLRLFDRRGGQWRTSSSTGEGVFSFESLPPGDYLLQGGAASNALSGSKEISVRG